MEKTQRTPWVCWRCGIIAAFMAAVALLMLTTATPALATTNLSMKVGYSQVISNELSDSGSFDYLNKVFKLSKNEDIDHIVSVKSSNRKTVEVDKDLIEARNVGKATVTVKVKTYAWDDDGYEATPRTITETIKVKVTGFPKLKKRYCDDLFVGSKYTFGKLMSDYSGGSVTATGKFVKGSGYKVYSKGKKIKFTKSGKVTVKYKVKGKTYKIICSKVHSLNTMKKQIKKSLKKKALVPNSLQLSSVKLKWKDGCKQARVVFTAKNAYGTRITQRTWAWYEDGTLETGW